MGMGGCNRSDRSRLANPEEETRKDGWSRYMSVFLQIGTC